MLKWLFGEKMEAEAPAEKPDDVIILLTRISTSLEKSPDDWVLELSGNWGNQKMGMSVDPSFRYVHIKFGGEKLMIHSEYWGGPRSSLIERIRSQTDALSARRMVEKLKKLEDQG